ncbi:MAG TPA: hypothetical protein VEL11_13150 [Candidatus Bathyarchaeia archaeon]|nr:hypothetical protein [Candidatus Bathyarchaeia archaeon]
MAGSFHRIPVDLMIEESIILKVKIFPKTNHYNEKMLQQIKNGNRVK